MNHNQENESEIFIPPDNRMAGSYTLYGIDDSVVDTVIEVMIPKNSTKDTEISVRVQESYIKDTILDVKYRGISDVLTEIQPIGHNSIYSEISVKPHNRMWALYEIQEPPKITDVFNPIQDSFTREKPEFQSINYGSNASLAVGRFGNEIFRSFIQFDFSNWNTNFVIIESKLRLHYSGEFPKGSKLEILTVDRQWHEYGITHLNRPSPISLLVDSYELNEEQRYIEFEFTNAVINWIQKNMPNNGFVVRLSNESDEALITFKARESNRPPELIITYYDARIYSTGRSQVLTEIFVWQVGESIIDSEITVSSVIDNSDILTELYVHRYEVPVDDVVDIEITVTKPMSYIEIEVAQSDISNILTELAVRSDHQVNKTDIEITVSKDYADSEIFVSYLNSIDTEITVERDQESIILTEISVSRDYIDTEIYVKYHSTVDTEITVERSIESCTDTEITVSRDNTHIELSVRVEEDNVADTELNVRAVEESNIETLIIVTKDFVLTEITVSEFSTVDTEIYVKHTDCVFTEITVSQFDYVDTEIDVVVSSIIPIEITVTRPQISTVITVPYWDESTTLIEIRPRILQVSDIATEITVAIKRGAYVFIL